MAGRRIKRVRPFAYDLEEDEIRRERNRARALRESEWWKRKKAKGVCHYCGRKVPPKELTMDHIIPVSRGGKSRRGNIVACCRDCNSKKRQLLPVEWDAYLF